VRAHPLKHGTSGYREYEEDGATKKVWISYGEHRFLLDDFLKLFEFEPDAATIRKAELRAVQCEVDSMLDLYVGKGVDTFQVREGEPAPRDVPLSIVQKKLLIDEELALHRDVNEWFDVGHIHQFFDELKTNAALLRQVFPTERCVLVMATTRRYVDYGKSDFEAAVRNHQNSQVMMFVRNGGNIHVVHSPVESHLGSSRLFPRRSDGDAIFRGVDGRQIKFDDLAFTDKLSRHESEALHYRRFLILLAGLDHRKKLMGDFYDEKDAFEFISEEFQEKYFRFIRDDDASASLPAERRASVKEWIAEMNSYVRPGSRIMGDWSTLITLETTPSAFERSSIYRKESDRRRLFSPWERFSIAVISRDGADLVTEVEVKGEGARFKERSFKAKVNLGNYTEPFGRSEHIPYLCLDKVRVEDVRWYLHNRGERANHIAFIRMFKVILATVEAERLPVKPECER
jgi:hypothetical protein